MTKARLTLFALLLGAVGCTDNIDTVSREYRALNNEAIDALMMVTTEAKAKEMTIRVFKPMQKRYQDIDRKLTIVKSNRDKGEFVKEMLESDGFHLYLTDLQVNSQRLTLEVLRLRNLRDQYVERERELLKEEGENPGFIDPKKVCPWIVDLVTVEVGGPMGGGGQDVLDPLKKALTKPEILNHFSQFPQWKVKDFDKMFLNFRDRRKVFTPAREIRLAW
jgi:hypothetical protein